MRSKFEEYLNKNHEVAFVERVFPSLVYAKGLPSAKLFEVVLFETGEVGQVLSMNRDHVEIIVFSKTNVGVGTKVVRTDSQLAVKTGSHLLGQVLDPLGMFLLGTHKAFGKDAQDRLIHIDPPGMQDRQNVVSPLETGISIVDLVLPLAQGQRELVIGDRKTGKTSFLQQVVMNQVTKGTVCIYAAIGKRKTEALRVIETFQKKGIMEQLVVVLSSAAESSGIIYLTPYTAMTIAEYFRDQGKHVLLILDDLTIHAQIYREISLLARKFPGRNSYPGDIFYIHSRLLERAGAFKKGAISCLAVAESVLGDLSGYIQTNLMSITDGHLFFDIETYNQGRRPAINPYLSVTRVGEQVQKPLVRDLSRTLSRFIVHYQKLRDLVHFGTEFEDRVKKDLSLGDKIFQFFNQPFGLSVPLYVSTIVLAILWSGRWLDIPEEQFISQVESLVQKYTTDQNFTKKIETLVDSSNSFLELVSNVELNEKLLS